MKVTAQARHFLTLLTMTVAPVFLMFVAYSVYYDGIHPSSAFTALMVATILVFIYGFLALVFAIGIGLYTVSVDISKNHGVAIMCAVEKYLVFLVFLIFFLKGDYNVGLFLPVVVDLIYGILFTEFLINYKKL